MVDRIEMQAHRGSGVREAKKVSVLTTVHLPFDTRIFHKEAKTLVHAGYEVSLIAQHGRNELVDGVRILSLPRPRNRLTRIFGLTWRAFRLALHQRAAIYHFHDPELLPIGVLLGLCTRAKVIYDVHEDVPQQILSKQWLPRAARRPAAWVMGAVEWLAGRVLTAIVAATPTIAARFPASKTVTVHNFPIQSELMVPDSVRYDRRPAHVAYIGGITRERGAFEMVEAVGQLRDDKVRLRMAGNVEPQALRDELIARPGWDRVDESGWADRRQLARLLGSVRAGLVVLHPTANYLDAYPVKMFEYMAAGMPVIASDFPLWKEIVEGNSCGMCVNPLDPAAIAQAIEYLLEHPEEAQRMGENGRRAVEEKYNWEQEEKKLLALYEGLIG